MTRELFIVGSGGLAREVALLVDRINAAEETWKVLGFVGPDPLTIGEEPGRPKVLGDDDWLLARATETALVIAVGEPRARARVARKFEGLTRFLFPNLIDPGASINVARVRMGKGNVITCGSVFTCDITAGDFNYFNLNTTVGHDVVIGSCNVLNPAVNVSGGGHIGNEVLIGTGAQLLENVGIGSRAVVGAGAVVTRDVAENSTVVGVPARPIAPKGAQARKSNQ